MYTNYNLENIDRRDLLTEQSNPLSNNIDNITTDELVELFVQEDKKPQQQQKQ